MPGLVLVTNNCEWMIGNKYIRCRWRRRQQDFILLVAIQVYDGRNELIVGAELLFMNDLAGPVWQVFDLDQLQWFAL